MLNVGSSSIRFKLFENTLPLISGRIEAIGNKISELEFRMPGVTITKPSKAKTHEEAIRFALEELKRYNLFDSLDEIKAVSHRVVHGGEYFKGPKILDKNDIGRIRELGKFAPLHNPNNLLGIEIFRELLPKAKQVAVFDTSFHQTMPKRAYRYAIPNELYEKEKIRRYGFHGTSHRYLSEEAIKLLRKEGKRSNRIITCHLGNGCSITAVKEGKSMDTSMGFTPLEGLPMGTRSGSIDPSIPLFLLEKMKGEEVYDLLNKRSGFFGLTGKTDMRDILAKYRKGNDDAILAIDIFTYRISQTIGSYITILGGLDAIVFSAGIGENVPLIRQKVCDNLSFLGLKLEKKENEKNEVKISSKASKIQAFVIPTDEELEIARETLRLILR